MARFVRFDRRHYSKNTGLIPLRLGDDWLLSAEVVDSLPGNYYQPVNLTGMSATAYFPTASGPMAADVVVLNANCGKISISLDQLLTPLASTASEGVGIYLVLEDSGELQTVETIDQALEILDRQFPSG